MEAIKIQLVTIGLTKSWPTISSSASLPTLLRPPQIFLRPAPPWTASLYGFLLEEVKAVSLVVPPPQKMRLALNSFIWLDSTGKEPPAHDSFGLSMDFSVTWWVTLALPKT